MMLLACIGVWLVRLVVSLVLRRRPPAAGPDPFPWRRWVMAPLVIALTVGLVMMDVPLRARFALSRPALDRFARAVIAEGQAAEGEPRHRPAWVGLFPIEEVEVLEEGRMRFLVRGAGFLDGVGFAYDPSGELARGSRGTYRPFSRPWWIYVDRW